MLRTFERKILMKIYGPIKENGIWRSRFKHYLYELYKKPEIVKTIKAGRVRWLGHLCRMQSKRPLQVANVPYTRRH
jgi:hypothetical protein